MGAPPPQKPAPPQKPHLGDTFQPLLLSRGDAVELEDARARDEGEDDRGEDRELRGHFARTEDAHGRDEARVEKDDHRVLEAGLGVRDLHMVAKFNRGSPIL